MSNKVIITTAITGGVHIPTMSKYLPITPEEIAAEAIASAQAGAAAVHIHARNPETGQPSGDTKLFQKIVDIIKAESDVIIGLTTGGAIGMNASERLSSIPVVRPELGSCNAGSMNFCFSTIADKYPNAKFDWELDYVRKTYSTPFLNTFADIEEYVRVMDASSTKPEFEIYDVGMINNLAFLKEKGILKTPIYLQFVLGILGGIPATVENLLHLHQTAVKQLGNDFVWSCAAAGRKQFDIITAAMLLGGNVRVGLEDNLFIAKGELANSNAQGVTKIRKVIETLDREIATPAQAREILGLKQL